MPMERAAPEIDPVDRIASKSAILPGPIRFPDARSMRMESFAPAMVNSLNEPAEVSRIAGFRQGGSSPARGQRRVMSITRRTAAEAADPNNSESGFLLEQLQRIGDGLGDAP